MTKKCVIIEKNGKPLLILPIRELEPAEYVAIVSESRKNLINYLAEQNSKIVNLQNQIQELKNEIKVLKGEDE